MMDEMFPIIFIGITFALQPVCTEAVFLHSMKPAFRGDNEIIARAVFDDYLDQIKILTQHELDRHSLQTPLEDLLKNKLISNQADALFDTLLDSLSVLDENRDWKNGVQTIRRTVFLNARESNNPWPETTWIDVSTIVNTTPDFLRDLDSFLLQHVDDDRNDRFIALQAILEGDPIVCVEAEQRTMKRWSIYDKLISPYENDITITYQYPMIPNISSVASLFSRIVETIQDKHKIEVIRGQMALYTTLHKKHKNDIIQRIKNVRIQPYVFYPLNDVVFVLFM
jgi:hypothetical protein